MGSLLRPFVIASAGALTVAAIIGCSNSSTAPGPTDCGGVAATGGHPAGTIDSVYPLSGRPFGVAVNSSGTVLIGRQDANDVVTGSISNFVFTNSIAAGADPGTLAMFPAGTQALVSNFNDPSIGLLDLGTNTQSGAAEVASNPEYVIIAPNATHFFVGTSANGVVEYGSSSGDSLATLGPASTGYGNNGMAFNSSGCSLYVSAQSSQTVTQINATTFQVVRTITVGTHPQEIAISPDSSELWVADEVAGVQVYDLSSGNLITTVGFTAGAFGLAMTPDGEQVYATLPGHSTIKIISRSGRNVLTTLPAGSPRRVTFDAAGTHAIVADENEGAILIN